MVLGKMSTKMPAGDEGVGARAPGADRTRPVVDLLEAGVEGARALPSEVNAERRLVLVGDAPHQEKEGDVDEEEEEYAFEDDEEAVKTPQKWMAIARFYSGQDYKTWVLFNELSKAWGRNAPVPVRELRDNRFLVEFDSEWLWSKVLHGGLWTFRG